jgi:hypothetical protein
VKRALSRTIPSAALTTSKLRVGRGSRSGNGYAAERETERETRKQRAAQRAERIVDDAIRADETAAAAINPNPAT